MDSIYHHLNENIAKNRHSSYTHPPYELEKKLILAIKQGETLESISILKHINALEKAKLSKLPLNSLKYSLVASCTLFTRAIIEAGVDSETAFMLSDYYINLIDQSTTKKDTQALEYKMLEDFISLLKTHKSYIYTPLINRTIAYIKKNIESKLSLQELAQVAGVHPNYLSGCFKKEVGIPLFDYISEQKIAAIKNYLTYTDTPIYDISVLFNFSSSSYFSKFFKAHTQLSPLEYRRCYQLKN